MGFSLLEKFRQRSLVHRIAKVEKDCSSLRTADTRERENAESPPEVEGTFAAYKVLFGAILCEAFMTGFTLAFGVFQNYYNQHQILASHGQSAWIGVICIGITYMGAPAVTFLCKTFDLNRQCYIWLGWIACVGALFGAAFCNSFVPLVMTQGVLFGVGTLFIELPSLIILNSWFSRRRGFVYGLVFAAADIFGVVYSYLIDALLQRYGLRTTFLACAAMCFVIPGPAIWLIRERPQPLPSEENADPANGQQLKESPTHSTAATENVVQPLHTSSPTRYYRSPIFYVLILSNLVQSHAFYLPFIYLPSFTTSLGHSSQTATTALALANLAQILGEIAFGNLSDRINNVHALAVASTLVSSLTTLLLWRSATSVAMLMVYAILYGVFASGFLALWVRMGMIFGESQVQVVYGLLSFGRGIGTIASGPISSALLKMMAGRGKDGGGIGGGGGHGHGKDQYEGIVWFVGACMAGSAVLAIIGYVVTEVETIRVRRRGVRVFS